MVAVLILLPKDIRGETRRHMDIIVSLLSIIHHLLEIAVVVLGLVKMCNGKEK